MRIVFDLDGVLRDLMGYLNDKYGVPAPTDYFWIHQGKNIYQWLEDDNLFALIYAPVTEYFHLIRKSVNIVEIWTHQPVAWRSKTESWITNNLGDKCLVNYFTPEEKKARLLEEKCIWLVEDNPVMAKLPRILLIDRLYNRDVETEHRIRDTNDLKVWLDRNESGRTL